MRAVAEENSITLSCGCSYSAPTKSSGRQVVGRCDEGERLWAELLEARDEMRATRWSRVGKKPALDAFAGARDDFHRHVFGGV